MRENVGRRGKCAVEETHLRRAGSQMNYDAEGPLEDLRFAALSEWIFLLPCTRSTVRCILIHGTLCLAACSRLEAAAATTVLYPSSERKSSPVQIGQ
jgi:hypothetical protein